MKRAARHRLRITNNCRAEESRGRKQSVRATGENAFHHQLDWRLPCEGSQLAAGVATGEPYNPRRQKVNNRVGLAVSITTHATLAHASARTRGSITGRPAAVCSHQSSLRLRRRRIGARRPVASRQMKVRDHGRGCPCRSSYHSASYWSGNASMDAHRSSTGCESCTIPAAGTLGSIG